MSNGYAHLHSGWTTPQDEEEMRVAKQVSAALDRRFRQRQSRTDVQEVVRCLNDSKDAFMDMIRTQHDARHAYNNEQCARDVVVTVEVSRRHDHVDVELQIMSCKRTTHWIHVIECDDEFFTLLNTWNLYNHAIVKGRSDKPSKHYGIVARVGPDAVCRFYLACRPDGRNLELVEKDVRWLFDEQQRADEAARENGEFM